MAKKTNSKHAVQTGFAFHVDVVQRDTEDFSKKDKKKSETKDIAGLGLNTNYKNFGDYIKNKRGNKL